MWLHVSTKDCKRILTHNAVYFLVALFMFIKSVDSLAEIFLDCATVGGNRHLDDSVALLCPLLQWLGI
jgi:hypothetical protein